MSQPPTSGPFPAPADHGPRRFAQSTPQRSPTQQHVAMHQAQRTIPQDGQPHLPVSLPPLRQMSNTPPTPLSERRLGGLLGVHSILNPLADLAEQQRNRRRSASQMDSPSPVDTQASQNLPSISRPTSVDSTQGEPTTQGRPFQAPGRPRHLLSPRSPTVHRAQSLSVLARPTGTIDAHTSPFLPTSGRPRGSDPATAQPALLTPPVGGRAGYFSQAPPTAPTPPPLNMVRNDLRRPSASFPQSGSASPNPNFSPFSQPASVASSQYEGQLQNSYIPPTNNPPMQESHQLSMTMDADRRALPTGPSSQSSIQIMTIKSQQGHHVQIPVEVQAASKVADEKRKRNAGASARFRARRKEKEREASHSISRLETQLREALEDIEYYRGERDYFKTIVFQQPGAERHYGRPSSPRLRRLSVAPSNAPSSTTGGGSAGSPYSNYDDEPPEMDRNVRRRTSNYHPPSDGSQPANYPGQAYASVNAPHPAGMPQNPPPSFEAHDKRPLPQMQQQQPLHSQRPALRDPFAPADAGRYKSQNWAPGPVQHRDQRG